MKYSLFRDEDTQYSHTVFARTDHCFNKLRQINLFHVLIQVHFNIIQPRTPKSSTQTLSVTILTKLLYIRKNQDKRLRHQCLWNVCFAASCWRDLWPFCLQNHIFWDGTWRRQAYTSVREPRLDWPAVRVASARTKLFFVHSSLSAAGCLGLWYNKRKRTLPLFWT